MQFVVMIIFNTPKQIMIYEHLAGATSFGHMSLIVNEERKKLSKRDGQILQFIEQYRDLGYLPEALFNFIALLGWSPEGGGNSFLKKNLSKSLMKSVCQNHQHFSISKN